MKVLALILSVFVIQAAKANITMKPGKWKIQTAITENGKVQPDHTAQMAQALKNLSPEQKKQVEAMMAKMGNGKNSPKLEIGPEGMMICFTKEMFETGSGMSGQGMQNCTTSDNKRVGNKISLKFKCQDGSSGTSEWTFVKDTVMTGVTKVTSTRGLTEMTYTAVLVNPNCD